jgi:hypothetical protein
MENLMSTSRRCLSLFALSVAFLPLAYAQTPLRLQPVVPCRLVDTRKSSPITGGMSEAFNLPQLAQMGGANGGCTAQSAPSTAQAYSLNITVIPAHTLNYLTIWPTGEPQPFVSLMNSYDGRIKANAAIVPAGANGAVSVYVTDTSNVLIDIDAYFDSASDNTALAFFPLPPCRLVDTRNNQDGGPLQKGQERDYTIPPTCNIPSNATAYSFNVTVLPTQGSLDYLTVWPKGEPMPVVSTLNDYNGDPAVANAAVVPAGTQNATAFYAHDNDTDLLVDTNGYFAPANSGSDGLSLYTLTPCRVLDTRASVGLFDGALPVGVAGSSCGIPGDSSEAFVFNATVVPQVGYVSYLTLWPEGGDMPTVSTLNAYDAAVTSNMAIVPAGMGNDSINAYIQGPPGGYPGQLILDISSYFAPVSAIAIQSSSLPSGTLNSGYSVPLVATGGVAPYTWTTISGNPPPGLSLSGAGTISGTATATGTYNFEVQASDSNSPAGTATANLSITVNSSAGTLAVVTTSLPSGTVNTPYNTLLTANGGITPYTWSVLSGNLPVGVSLNSSTGLISGVPGAAGLSNLVVQVTDSLGNTNNQQFVVIVNSGSATGTLNGMYAGSFTGWDNGNFFVSAFSITADGNGNLTAGEFDYNSPALGPVHTTLTSGSYTMGSDGLGQITWTDSSNASVQLLVSAGTAEGMHVIGYNQNGSERWGSGALRQQNPSDFAETGLAGNWAFGYQGFDPMAHPLSGDGVFTATSNGNITGSEDINDDGTHGQPTFTGSATGSIDSNGRFTVQYDVQGIGTIHLAAYTVSAGETIAIETDTGGSLYVINSLKQSGGSFGLGSFNGSAVGGGSRIHNGDQNQAIALLVASSGNGHVSFTEDLNSGGSFTTSQLTGTVTVASNGRADATLSDSSQEVCYLVATNEAFCINAVPAPGSNDHGAEVIFLEPQVGMGQFSAASFSGEYLGGSLPQYLPSSGTYTQIDSNVASGGNTFASTYSQCGISGCPSLNQTLSGTYNDVNANTGAFTISQAGSPLYAGFMVSTNKVIYVTAGSGSVPLTLIEVTSSAP